MITVMPRRMREASFRAEQWSGRYASHIELINRLVDDLGLDEAGGGVPYVAPIYGGMAARVLSLLRDPGPKADGGQGSGFLCIENDDASAELMGRLWEEAGISPSDVVPWNVYPWYINANPTAAQLEQGLAPLLRLMDLLPRLRVVILHGGSARQGWRKLVKRHPSLVRDRGLRVIPTHHTSRQAFWHKDPEVREARLEHIKRSLAEVAEILNAPADHPGPQGCAQDVD